jgi:ribosomal protein L11 methyltransferase
VSVEFRMAGRLEDLDAESSILWDAGCTGLMQDGEEVVAYFGSRVDLPLEGRWQEVEEQDWLGAYYADLKPVVLERLIVAPTHCDVAPEGRKVLWLDPGMAFGTGHHETTRLALRALERLELAGRRVLDVGAGSGILAIAADLLGATEAAGIDLDADTVRVAEANASLNDSRATFTAGTLYQTTRDADVDVVVANLYAELHAQLASEYARVLVPQGDLLVTGILGDRLPLVEDALAAHFEMTSVQHEGDWALLQARKRA